MVLMNEKVKQIRAVAFPLEESLEGEFKVCDHLNLCGEAIQDLGFIPISDLYQDKNNLDAIKVACLKEGVEPTQKEKEILLGFGIKAYSYELIEPALRAASEGLTVEASVYFPKLPKGFCLEAKACQIKKSGELDLGIISSIGPCTWAGTFTKNKVRAFCVDKNFELLSNQINVIACNSGNANACTGEAGKKADLNVRAALAKKYECKEENVLLASTGKIGVTLPDDKIINALDSGSFDTVDAFAQAILTTDTCIKISQDSSSHFLAFAKGSGMIHPNMATMLAFVITDVKIEDMDEKHTRNFMKEILKELVDDSFNSISVDGDTSTNDMCICLTNGLGEVISKTEFVVGLKQVLDDLAYKVIADGEGISKLSKLTIKSDLNKKEARDLGRFVLNSLLVKTALHGNDPNWGRIMASVGQYCSERELAIDFNRAKLNICDVEVFADGVNTDFSRDSLIEKMKKSFEIGLELDLDGSESITVFGNDLSNEYIRINAEYFT
jgi:glutamate N-acetyltransferase/amino-acid N-acetyltransferase